jgi:hypothetical protein
VHAANAAWCMTPIQLAANAAGCTSHAPNLIFMKPPKLLQAYYASIVFELIISILEFLLMFVDILVSYS